VKEPLGFTNRQQFGEPRLERGVIAFVKNDPPLWIDAPGEKLLSAG
jgi:hypothetical protein